MKASIPIENQELGKRMNKERRKFIKCE